MRTGTHLRRPGKQPFRDDAIGARDRPCRTIGKREMGAHGRASTRRCASSCTIGASLMHSGRVPAMTRIAGRGPRGNPGYGCTRPAGSCTEAVAASNKRYLPEMRRLRRSFLPDLQKTGRHAQGCPAGGDEAQIMAALTPNVTTCFSRNKGLWSGHVVSPVRCCAGRAMQERVGLPGFEPGTKGL